jgi:hypothetical protein
MTLRGASVAFEHAPILWAARQQRSRSGVECEMDASRRRFGTTCCRMSKLSSEGQRKGLPQHRAYGTIADMGRWINFLLFIAIGAAAGMFYSWVISPVEYVDTAPDSLRIDYKTDYVLMVAEAYRVENSAALAARRLALLGSDPPLEIANEAIVFANQIGYDPNDLALMQSLVEALENWNPSLEMPEP